MDSLDCGLKTLLDERRTFRHTEPGINGHSPVNNVRDSRNTPYVWLRPMVGILDEASIRSVRPVINFLAEILKKAGYKSVKNRSPDGSHFQHMARFIKSSTLSTAYILRLYIIF